MRLQSPLAGGGGQRKLRSMLLAAIALGALLSTRGADAQGTLYFVNTTSDTVVAGACSNNLANCSLRGAIQTANSHFGEDGIEFSLPAGSVINLTQALPGITESVGIFGPGADKLTVRRSSSGDYRIFTVAFTNPVAVTFSGLTLSNGRTTFSATEENAGGGAIQNVSRGTVNVVNCVLSGNVAAGAAGGALFNINGTMNVIGCTITANSAQGGGGIVNSSGAAPGTLYVTNSVISDNTVSNAESGGGIITGGSGSTATINNCTLSGNKAGTGGGISNSATLTVINSTLTGNFARFGKGGAISNSGTLNLSNSTLTGNTVTVQDSGGGIATGGSGSVNIKSTIVALNIASSDPDITGAFTSRGFNLIGRNDGAAASFPAGQPNANNDLVGTSASPLDPRFDPNGLQNNGGPTRTIALLFGSPATDKGTSNSLAGQLVADQRDAGFPRTFDDPGTSNATGGEGTDIGSFELQTAPPPPTPTPTVAPTPTPTATPIASSLGNISTRLRVLTGDHVLFGGMIATGTAGKRVIIRAIGPTLTDLGVPNSLADPTLDLFQDSSPVSGNDDWRNSPQEAEIASSGFAPNKDAESAIIATLIPGQNYTAIVRGKNGETGIGLVEVFDLDPAAAAKLGNISTRGFVDVDDNVMIAGLIVTPNNAGSLHVLIRALGPTLGEFGVPGFLEDPRLELVDASGTVLRSNASWQSDQALQIQSANLAPKYDQEAALIETLAPGQYTAIVRGTGGTTGVGLVEVYNIP